MNSEPHYIAEVNGSEVWLPNRTAARELLERLAASAAVEIWLLLDRGARQRSWVSRMLGFGRRNVEPCFWLTKTGDVAALTFLDGNWSEYRATDPAFPVAATDSERLALSCGEPTPAPPEVCLRADRAFRAATESLHDGTRPTWLTYRFTA